MATIQLDASPVLASSTALVSSTTAQPVPTASSSDPDDAKHDSRMSNLYLVTFLATLFILLLLSGAIVVRSYCLRRRYQRRLEEALAAGLVLAPRAQGGKRKRFGAKPGLFEVYLREPTHPTKSGKGSAKYGHPSVGERNVLLAKSPLGGTVVTAIQWGSWETIVPLSAQPIFVKRKYRGIAEHSSASPGRLINLDDLRTDSVHDGVLSILATRPPPARFLNLFGIDAESYSEAYAAARRRAQTEQSPEARQHIAAQAMAAARTRSLERVFHDLALPPVAREQQRNAPIVERPHAPEGYMGTPTPEQRADYEQAAADVQNFFAAWGVDWRAPPPVWEAQPALPETPGAGEVVVQMADGTRAVGVPIPIPVENSDSEDEGGTDAAMGGRAQRHGAGQTTERGVVLDTELNTASAAPEMAATTPSATADVTPGAAIPPPQDSVRADAAPQNSSQATEPAAASNAAKVRIEMLQIAVLIAMPTPHRNSRCGKSSSSSPKSDSAPTHASAPVRPHPRESLDEDFDEVSVKSGLSSTDGEYADCAESLHVDDKGANCDDGDDDDDECDADRPLPEVVLGVARVQYSHPSTADLPAVDHDDDDVLGVTASGTHVAVPARTTATRPSATRGSSLGGSAAFGIPG